MGRTKLTSKLLLLEPKQAKMLVELATETRYSQSALVRQALDDLLEKYSKRKQRQTRK